MNSADRPLPAGSQVPDKPTLDGLEDKWSRRWAQERVVQV
jgi:hypothetical protein